MGRARTKNDVLCACARARESEEDCVRRVKIFSEIQKILPKDLIRKTLDDERFTREDWKKKNLEEEEEEEDFYSPSRRRHTFSFLVRTKNEIVINERESNPQSSPSSVT